ncbi:TetR/AcrR family transcriptional regulator [Nocardioides sp. P5_C9_2]
MPTPQSPRRREILDAAVVVLAGHGLKGLTHRGIDREAGLPEGSSSAYFRSRAALQQAVAEHVSDRLVQDVADLSETLAGGDHGVDQAVRETGALFGRWLSHPDLVLARLELTLAATRDAELAVAMTSWRAQLVELVRRTLGAGGRPDDATHAATIVAALDGVLLAALQRPARQRPAFLRSSLELLLGSLVEPPTPT